MSCVQKTGEVIARFNPQLNSRGSIRCLRAAQRATKVLALSRLTLRGRLATCVAAALALSTVLPLPATCFAAGGDTYPARPVRLVVPFAPGGGLDILARLLGQKFTDSMRQTAIVDNRTGAGGNIGAEIVAKAAPDGHTLLLTSTSLAVNASLNSQLPYDARKDFAPVSLIASVPLVLVVSASIPARSLKELVALIKAKPGTFTFASNGSGTTSHLSGELLNILTGAKMTHVPYKGGAPATTSVARRRSSSSRARRDLTGLTRTQPGSGLRCSRAKVHSAGYAGARTQREERTGPRRRANRTA